MNGTPTTTQPTIPACFIFSASGHLHFYVLVKF